MNNFIYIRKNAFSKKQCNNVIYKLNTERIFTNEKNVPQVRSYKGLEVNPYHQEWFKEYCTALEEYKTKNNYLGKKISRWQTDNRCNYQKYEPGKYYKKEHCEHGYKESLRILAWMFYCNTIKKGGGTYFPQQDITVQPQAGTIFIWPAAWTHSHYGISAPRELKYIITGWCKLTNLT